ILVKVIQDHVHETSHRGCDRLDCAAVGHHKPQHKKDIAVMPGVVVAVLWALIALILFLVGRSQIKQVKGVPQTVDTLKEIPETLKRNEENR
ncbi:phage holin family protein, partial [Propionibacterium freudenreichii]